MIKCEGRFVKLSAAGMLCGLFAQHEGMLGNQNK